MKTNTTKRRAVYIDLPADILDKLRETARTEERSVSNVARRLLVTALS